jgi:hypothetical protein
LPFGLGVRSNWDQAVAWEGLIMLLFIAFSKNLFTSYCFAIVCNLGACLFLGEVYQSEFSCSFSWNGSNLAGDAGN